MKSMSVFLIVIFSLIALIVMVSAYFGAFRKQDFRLVSQGGETVVYQEIRGEYKQSAAVMDRIYYSLLNDHQITTYRGFGIYYDNPRVVEKSKLRSEAGCIIEPEDIARITQLPFKSKVLPVKQYLVTDFPYRGRMSVFFSLIKVYPAMNRHIAENFPGRQAPITEIYDIPNKWIIFRMEL